MKNILIWLVSIVGLTYSAWAQQKDTNEITPLKVGDVVPELVFRQLVNYPDSTTKLSDFEGKAVVIDFWASWCFPCVAAFPKLEKIQEKFGDHLQVMLVSSDTQEEVSALFNKKKGFSLPSAISRYSADTIRQLFQFKTIPHVVWIGKDRRIYAITGARELTEEAVDHWLKGGQANMAMKSELEAVKLNAAGAVIDSLESDGMITKISVDSSIHYQSVFRAYDPRLTSYQRYGPHKRFAIDLPNSLPAHMVRIAHGFVRRNERAHVVYDVANKDLYKFPSNHTEAWKAENLTSYRLIMPAPDSVMVSKIMQEEMERMFNLWAYKKRAKVPCLVLRVSGDTTALCREQAGKPSQSESLFHLEFINQPVSQLVYLLNALVDPPHEIDGKTGTIVVDETGITGLISFSLTDMAKTTDLDELNKAFKTVGLELVPDTREFEMLYVTDKPREQVFIENTGK